MQIQTPATPATLTDTVFDPATRLEWTRAPLPGARMTHAEAEAACAACRLGGHSDWRLPTVKELFGLADHTRYNPAIDPETFPDTPSAAFWSSSPVASAPDCAWVVHFYYGDVGLDLRDNLALVRAVRSLPASQ